MKIAPKKNLGQNFLIDENVIDQIIDIANISREDSVLEVGPGTGALTKKIIEKKPKEITVIEKDKRLADSLKENYSEKIKVINEDMLNFSYRDYSDKNLIIFGNLPYNISSQILIKFINYSTKKFLFKKLIFMFQKEVAERILSKPHNKNYSRLSVITQYSCEVKKELIVKSNVFFPKPDVDSCVLSFKPRKEVDPEEFDIIQKITKLEFQKVIIV